MPRYQHILIVDDTGMYREGAALQLRLAHPEVTVSQAKYPDDALRELATEAPDLIILDLEFDDRPLGLPFLQSLKAHDTYARIPVIVMSAHRFDPNQVQTQLLAAGAAGYIWKGVEGGPEIFKVALMTMELGGNFIHGTIPADAQRIGNNRLIATDDLSESDLRVLARHCIGIPYKVIASECRLADQTVADKVLAMTERFKARNSKHLIWLLANAGVTFDASLYANRSSKGDRGGS